MIEKIRLRNFQALRDVTIELGDITVLTAPSDTGKSSVIRGLLAFFQNSFNSEYAHNGNFPCEVSLTKNGVTALGRRTTKGVEYQLGKVEYTKTGKKFPEDISSFLGIKEHRIDVDTSVFLNVQSQFDPPFLLTKQDNALLSKIIGKISNLNIVLAAIRKLNSDLLSKKQDITYFSGKKAEVERELINLNQIESLRKRRDEIKGKRDEVDSVIFKSNSVRKLLEAVRFYEDKKERVALIHSVNKERDFLTSLLEKYEKLNKLKEVEALGESYVQRALLFKDNSKSVSSMLNLLKELQDKFIVLMELKAVLENPFSSKESKASLIEFLGFASSKIAKLCSVQYVVDNGNSYLLKVSAYKQRIVDYNNQKDLFASNRKEFLEGEVICPYSNNIMQPFCKEYLIENEK